VSVAVAEWLRARGAQHDVVSWAEAYGADGARLWAECPRGDWLLAIAVRASSDPAAIARAAVAAATLALELVPDDDALARALLEAARRGASRGEPVPRDAVDALEREAERAPDPVVQLARLALVTAARAVGGDVAEAPLVPSLLAQAAAMDAGDCAMMAAVSYVQRRSADLVRAELSPPVLSLP
jgi:hypothetical protein